MAEDERRFIERRKFTNRRKNFSPTQNVEGEIRVGSLIINRLHKLVKINDVPVNLSHKEFKIIDCLAENLGCVVETDNIIKKVWSECARATKADVYQYVHMLRKKIEVDPKNPKLLITVKGFGYELHS